MRRLAATTCLLSGVMLAGVSCGGSGSGPRAEGQAGTAAGTSGAASGAGTNGNGNGSGSGSGSGGANATAGSSGNSKAGSSHENGVAGSGTVSGTAGAGTGTSTGCMAGDFLQSLGKDRLLAGSQQSDAIAGVPFDLQYVYISGSFADSNEACSSCASGCSTNGASCANTVGCSWWGCWQYDQDPPGFYVRDFVAKANGAGALALITYYQILQASGASEGAGEVAAANDAGFMTRYFNYWKFLLEQVGQSQALLQIEPDFWGYAAQVNLDPTQIPAAVASAEPADCGNLPNTLTGMGQCMVAMTRKYAPNAKVGLHASGWGTGHDTIRNTNGSLNVAAEGTKLGNFLRAAAPDADFITADLSDRDAAWWEAHGKQTWLDATNQSLPHFHQAFGWAKAVAEAAAKPILWWQVPVGNMALDNTNQRYRDNCVDYLMGHLDEVAAHHGIGVAFGAGDGEQTHVGSDGGNLIAKARAYAEGLGQKPCP